MKAGNMDNFVYITFIDDPFPVCCVMKLSELLTRKQGTYSVVGVFSVDTPISEITAFVNLHSMKERDKQRESPRDNIVTLNSDKDKHVFFYQPSTKLCLDHKKFTAGVRKTGLLSSWKVLICKDVGEFISAVNHWNQFGTVPKTMTYRCIRHTVGGFSYGWIDKELLSDWTKASNSATITK